MQRVERLCCRDVVSRGVRLALLPKQPQLLRATELPERWAVVLAFVLAAVSSRQTNERRCRPTPAVSYRDITRYAVFRVTGQMLRRSFNICVLFESLVFASDAAHHQNPYGPR